MSSELVKKTAEYVRKKLAGEVTGHDWYHVERVWKMARRLQQEEGGDSELVELASLLHDLGDNSVYEFDERAFLVLHGMMDVLEISDELQEKIVKIADESRYRGDGTKHASTAEGKIVQDADLLDALGALGIARIFASGGRMKRVLHDPKRRSRRNMTKEDFTRRKTSGTSFNYFYEKALKIPVILNTKTAKEIAKHRAQFLKEYMDEFLEEWEGKK